MRHVLQYSPDEVGPPFDTLVGTIGLVHGLLAFGFGCVGLYVASTMSNHSFDSFVVETTKKSVMVLISMAYALGGPLLFASSIGLYQSKRWAYWLLIATSTLVAPCFAIMVPVAAVVALLFSQYCIMRLAGIFRSQTRRTIKLEVPDEDQER